MQQTNQQQRARNTPKKGRPRRDSTQSPRNVRPVKNYASENDVPRDSAAVRTPRRNAAGAPQANSVMRANSGSAVQRSNGRNNRGRPANVTTGASPTSKSGKAGRDTPPHSAKPTSTAFAGATFHTSPAPSSLPMPSFMKAAMDSPIAKHPVNVSQEPSPPASDSEAPTPPPPSFLPRPGQEPEESPLDIFFRAQRAEKERDRRASSATGAGTASSPFSPPNPSPFFVANAPLSPDRAPQPRVPVLRNATTGISAAELDGTPGRPVGPAFSTPYSERIRAARNGGGLAQLSPSLPRQPKLQPAQDKAEAIKQILFGKPSVPTTQPFPSGNQFSTPAHNPAAATFNGSYTLSAHVFNGAHHPLGPAFTAAPAAAPPTISKVSTGRADHGRPQDIQYMENQLRQILNIN